jgi:hypothetical protein
MEAPSSPVFAGDFAEPRHTGAFAQLAKVGGLAGFATARAALAFALVAAGCSKNPDDGPRPFIMPAYPVIRPADLPPTPTGGVPSARRSPDFPHVTAPSESKKVSATLPLDTLPPLPAQRDNPARSPDGLED